ncbi:hypothetical protein ABFS83_10G101400 [Erythranthe nasuta]
MGFNDSKQVINRVSLKKQEYADVESTSSNNSDSMTSSSFSSSLSSSSSSELADDASSSPSSIQSNNPPLCSGPLYQLTELMAQLPIKRGLSKFYNGRSQTFASLGDVKSVDDLAKKDMSYCTRMKPCKSYGGTTLMNHYYTKFGPKATITKRSSKRPISSSFATSHVTMLLNA